MASIEREVDQTLVLVALLLPLAAIIYIIAYLDIAAAAAALAALAALLIVVTPFRGYCAFVVLYLLSEDFPLQGPGSTRLASLFATKIGPLPASTVLLVLLVLVAFMTWSLGGRRGERGLAVLDRRVLLFAALLLPSWLLVVDNLDSGRHRIFADVYPVAYFFAFYYATRIHVDTDERLLVVLRLMVAAIAAKVALCAGLLLVGIGASWDASLLRVTFDSGIRFFPLALFWPLVLLFAARGKLSAGRRLLLVLLAFVAVFAIATLVTRLLMLTTILGLLLMPREAVSRRGKLLVAGFGLLSVVALSVLNPEMSRSLVARTAQLFESPLSSERGEFKALSQVVRIIEGINVYATLKSRNALLWGAGPGSWFNDAHYPFPFASLIGKWDYDEQTLATARIYAPHFPWVAIFFKEGLLGVVAHVMLFVTFFRALKRRLATSAASVHPYYLAFWGAFVTLAVSFHTPKVYGGIGMLMGVVALEMARRAPDQPVPAG
uniref:Uncharacterized protein n=1 Tax=Geobacter metallireducens TaxID=28232 RepID=A0A831UCY4_GEOME